MDKNGIVLMRKYELGRLLGQGTFAKVYHARNIKTGESVAIKVIDKQKVAKVGLIDQIKREISVMRLVRHPHVVFLHEVMASKTKIYFAMEYVKGGELFDKVSKGKLKEDIARKYFQQLIGAIDYCHSRGVYHRDLKPENLLLDENGDLKISDFGLSALRESKQQDGLLHTTCGTPAYVAPEVIGKKGYDGAKADVWSCGVVLYVLLAGFLPFHEQNLVEMYRKITKGEFKCPNWFPPEVKKLLSRILDPNPNSRIKIEKIMENSWFQKGFKKIETPKSPESHQIDSLISDVHAAFSVKPMSYNAFDLISSLSQGFDLSGLFEKEERSESKFTTKKDAKEIVSKFEEIATSSERFNLTKSDVGVKMEDKREGRKGHLAIDVEIFEVTNSFHMVEFKKSGGDTMEYKQFCDRELRPSLKDIVWKWQGNNNNSNNEKIEVIH
ncbi:putative CBL-interacting serine/threonine-protein kinase 20 CAMK-CAMKL-CHK1 family [Arabidopsis thaliana]|uniref:non-specific serine/threonine protein kinase n=2 Tax=Arabidopsis TaxID=3701 RepID=A0A178UMR9_ARATH|nr:NAF domain [Arabidopsis thaliana x Arabidopsis arenosa]OAO95346.1 SnRK3.6 [Arabidopsis thaliana]